MASETPAGGGRGSQPYKRKHNSSPGIDSNESKRDRVVSPKDSIKVTKNIKFSGETLARLLKVKRVPQSNVEDNETNTVTAEQLSEDMKKEGGTSENLHIELASAMCSKPVQNVFRNMIQGSIANRDEQINEITKQTDAHADCIGTLHDRIGQLESEMGKLVLDKKTNETRIEELERLDRDRSLVFDGIPEVKDTRLIEHVCRYLNTKMNLGLKYDDIISVMRLGGVRKDNSPRPVMIRFDSVKHRKLAFNGKKALGKERLYVKDFLTKKTQAIFTEGRLAVKNGKLGKVWMRQGHVYIGEKDDRFGKRITEKSQLREAIKERAESKAEEEKKESNEANQDSGPGDTSKEGDMDTESEAGAASTEETPMQLFEQMKVNPDGTITVDKEAMRTFVEGLEKGGNDKRRSKRIQKGLFQNANDKKNNTSTPLRHPKEDSGSSADDEDSDDETIINLIEEEMLNGTGNVTVADLMRKGAGNRKKELSKDKNSPLADITVDSLFAAKGDKITARTKDKKKKPKKKKDE